MMLSPTEGSALDLNCGPYPKEISITCSYQEASYTKDVFLSSVAQSTERM